MSAPLPVVIDTDPGIDDALAILGAFADPGIDLLGLTCVFGNVPIGTASRNARALCALAGRRVPVAEGAAGPLARPPRPHADFVHGADGFGGAPRPEPLQAPDPRSAARFLVETCTARPGAVTLVAIGPLTNLANALADDPQIARTAARVVVMGGALHRPGNVTPHAEANIWQDPEAAAAVLSAAWPVTLVGLDLTMRTRMRLDDLDRLAAVSPRTAAFLRPAVAHYAEFHRRTEGFDGCFLHDPAAVMAALHPALFVTQATPVAVTLEGEQAGRTVEGGAGPPVSVCLDGDISEIQRRFLDGLASGRLP